MPQQIKNMDIMDGILAARDNTPSKIRGPRKKRTFKPKIRSSLRYSLRFLAFHQIQDDVSGEWIDDILENDETPEINTFSDVSVLDGIQPISAHNMNMSEPMSMAVKNYHRAMADAEGRRVRIQLISSEATYRVYEKRADGSYPMQPAKKFDIVKDEWPN